MQPTSVWRYGGETQRSINISNSHQQQFQRDVTQMVSRIKHQQLFLYCTSVLGVTYFKCRHIAKPLTVG